MSRTRREIAEQVRRHVAGEDVAFADLFAEDGVLRFPFAVPGMPAELVGRDAIRSSHPGRAVGRKLLEMDGVDLIVREGADPAEMVLEIEHWGRSLASGAPYRFRAIGVVRVHDGEIVSYDDYMNPVAMAEILGRTADLAAALTAP